MLDVPHLSVFRTFLLLKILIYEKETNRTSLLAIEKVYKAQVVSENYHEIYFFWAGKGTCCIPDRGGYIWTSYFSHQCYPW
ncbi:hypothetical protein RchiOBHm_Chr5g0083691 [Rosa chinensis]|uniref:Uncharacterized protein n=1 Tax=Rosa chinensis TaxID=74649 RepID=A0A2P6QNM7_ROSCH|nr:hypothetical protein RchiOBHm_Chr5g0083691 [Rosa chinensis]